MAESDLYENLRRLLGSSGNAIGLPKHEVTRKLLTNMFLEEEAKILISSFDKCGELINIRTISKKSGVPKEELTEILDDMYHKGKLMKLGPYTCYYPIFQAGSKYILLRTETIKRG